MGYIDIGVVFIFICIVVGVIVSEETEKKARSAERDRWQKEAAKLGYARYADATGRWEWKSHEEISEDVQSGKYDRERKNAQYHDSDTKRK